MPTTVHIQPAGALHRFQRPAPAFSLDNIVERPERLRAVNCGLAVALARLEAVQPPPMQPQPQAQAQDDDDLVKALEGLALGKGGPSAVVSPAQPKVVVSAPAPAGLIRSKAVEFVHHPPSDDPDEVRYLDSFVGWVKACEGKWAAGESEIPADLPQLDLYLCRASMAAIEGALSTTIEAVDAVVAGSRSSNVASSSTTPALPPPPSTAFCAIRPPGHHCGEDNPMGFCFVNNVAVGAAHAYMRHDIDRVIILDIDLHHGNGTQEIALRLNEDTYREELLVAGGKPAEAKRGLKVFYGSVHDIYSFPCEDGNLERVKDASLNLAAHGQYIENVHLLPYTSPADFWARCYPRYLDLLARARHFLADTAASPDRTLVFVSAGFDACEHEGAGMQRHGGNVPVGFYERFHRDAVGFARAHARGRVVSVLEGGYGDRALASGAMASLVGLSALPESVGPGQTEEWWSVTNLVKMEKALKRPSRRSARPPTFSADDAWLARTVELFAELEGPFQPASSTASSPAKGTRAAVVRSGERMMTRTRSGDKSLAGVLDRPSGTTTPAEPVKEEAGEVVRAVKAEIKAEVKAAVVSVPEAKPRTSSMAAPAPDPSSIPISALVAPVVAAALPPTPPPPPPPPPSSAPPAPIQPTSAPPPIQPTFANLPPPNPASAPSAPPGQPPALVGPKKIILKFRNPMAATMSAGAQAGGPPQDAPSTPPPPPSSEP